MTLPRTPTADAPRPPDVEGALADAPLPHLIVHLSRRALTGTLVLRGPVGEGLRLFVRAGAPTKIASEPATSMLGELLTRAGVLDRESLDDAVLRARLIREPLGASLIREGWVDRATIDAALRRQILDRLAAASALPPQAVYEFYAGVDLVRDARGEDEIACDPLAALTVAVRGWRDLSRAERALARLAGVPLTLHAEATPARFGFLAAERAVLDAIVHAQPTLEQLTVAGHPPAATRAAVYALALARHLSIGEGDEPPLALGERYEHADLADLHAPHAPAPRSEEHSDPTFAPTPMPAASELARSMIPPPAARPPTFSPDAAPIATSIAASTSAHATPTPEPARPAVTRSSTPPPRAPSTPPPPAASAAGLQARALTAARHYALGERALDAGDVHVAKIEADAAATLDPRPEHRALAALARALEGSAVEQVLALQVIDRLVHEAGQSLRPLRYRGQLLQRLGRHREARRDFEAVLASDPYDVVAGRAIKELSTDTQRPPHRR